MREFGTGAKRSENQGKLDYRGFISPLALKRFAEYMHKHRVCEDGTLRSSDNWKKGMPVESYVESFVRHTVDLWAAYEDGNIDEVEDLACAVFFNIQGVLHETQKSKRKG